jgi:undecaprenyl-diphosphatase
LKINRDWTNPTLDSFFAGLTDIMKTPVFVKIILPLGLIGLVFWKRKVALQVLASIAITVAITDFTSYTFFKSIFDRDRPHYSDIGATVRVPYAPTSKSFPSNHALNSFAIANILAFYWPAGAVLFWIYALLMAYSRVYVGVHYPLDIFAGMLFGIILAVLIRRFILLRIQWLKKNETDKEKQ